MVEYLCWLSLKSNSVSLPDCFSELDRDKFFIFSYQSLYLINGNNFSGHFGVLKMQDNQFLNSIDNFKEFGSEQIFSEIRLCFLGKHKIDWKININKIRNATNAISKFEREN